MGDAIFATWYDLDPGDEAGFLDWCHAEYLPHMLTLPGLRWAAHYRNVGHGPALKDYDKIAGHAGADANLGTGSQFVVMLGAARTHDLYAPLVFDLPLPESFAAPLAQRRGLRRAILCPEVQGDGPAAGRRRADGVPAAAIQFGTFRVTDEAAEADINCWYAQQRFPVMMGLPGCVGLRKFLCSTGWAKHAILYEFESLEARTAQFEVPHESQINDPGFWTGRIVRTTLHTPGSPVVGQRIWPPLDAAEAV